MSEVFTVERVVEPIQAWEYDGTGNTMLGEDRSTWPVWLQKYTGGCLGFTNGGTLFFYHSRGRTAVYKGHILVWDEGELKHFESRGDFKKRYRPVSRPDRKRES